MLSRVAYTNEKALHMAKYFGHLKLLADTAIVTVEITN